MAKLTGPSGGDEVEGGGDSPGGAADSGVASGDEYPPGGKDLHRALPPRHLNDRHDNTPVVIPSFSSVASPSRWMAFPGVPDI